MAEFVWRYWGKPLSAAKSESQEHGFVYHSLDVVAVADAWTSQSETVQRLFSAMYPWVRFFIALHDYGKLCVRFQCKSMETVRRMGNYSACSDGWLGAQGAHSYRHGPQGFGWLKMELADCPECDPTADRYARWDHWGPWMGAVAGHHGAICVANQAPAIRQPDEDRTARLEWLQLCSVLFLEPAGLSLRDDPPAISPELQSILAGFCSVCDWLGSGDAFTYRGGRTDDLNSYLEERRPIAEQQLRKNGLVRPALRHGGISVALSPNYAPRQVQRYVDSLQIEAGLTIIEAPTGSGKTEAALGYASRLLADGIADSIIFALPTQATANAMLPRLEVVAPRLFPGTDSNMVLAHGRSRFNTDAIRLRHIVVQEEGEATVHLTEWLAQSRKRVFLGQIGVCTVDQVLLSVLPVRHHFVRSFSIGRSVLIVDEVHAYDAYMYGLLQCVLEQQREAGGAVILLSATLPWHQRRRLIQAWQPDADVPKENDYPLITQITNGQTITTTLAKSDRPQPREVLVQARRMPDCFPNDNVLAELIDAAEAGARVVVIVNLVDHAQRLTRALRDRTAMPIDLFHARFRFRDRMQREKEILAFYGKDQILERYKNGIPSDSGRILVATQVVEQSLDLDFDWMVTQLCPADLLFQRIGRLHRDLAIVRPPGFESPRCTVLLGEGDDYGLHGVIYGDQRALWRTEQLLLQLGDGGAVLFPDAYRAWIEPVYDDDGDDEEPEWVRKAYDNYWGEQNAALKQARMLSGGRVVLNDNDATVVALTRDGDQSVSVLPLLANNSQLMLLDGRSLASLGKFAQVETVMLETIRVPQGWRGHLPKAEEDGTVHLRLNPLEDGVWEATAGKVRFRYSLVYGLEKNG